MNDPAVLLIPSLQDIFSWLELHELSFSSIQKPLVRVTHYSNLQKILNSSE